MTIDSIGQILSAAGTILAIVNPSIGARWGGREIEVQELILQARYWLGTALIVIGTLLQVSLR